MAKNCYFTANKGLVNPKVNSTSTSNHPHKSGATCIFLRTDPGHKFARTFGFADRARRHKEVDVGQDLRLLTETMLDGRLRVLTANRPVYDGATGQYNCWFNWDRRPDTAGSEIHGVYSFNCMGSSIRYPVGAPDPSTETEDPLLNGSAFDRVDGNPFARDSFNDVDDGDAHEQRYLGLGSLGGGLEYSDHI